VVQVPLFFSFIPTQCIVQPKMLKLMRRKSQAFRKKFTDNPSEAATDFYPPQPRYAEPRYAEPRYTEPLGHRFDSIAEEVNDNYDE
jgi:hypothetical protein